jgi:hypothetical protein
MLSKLLDHTSYGRDQAELIKQLRRQISYMDHQTGRLYDELTELRNELAEYKTTNIPSLDMNTLFAIVVDYHRLVKRGMLPDPIESREDVRKLHEKYHVTWPPKR